MLQAYKEKANSQIDPIGSTYIGIIGIIKDLYVDYRGYIGVIQGLYCADCTRCVIERSAALTER